jgi:hypothetical protein
MEKTCQAQIEDGSIGYFCCKPLGYKGNHVRTKPKEETNNNEP